MGTRKRRPRRAERKRGGMEGRRGGGGRGEKERARPYALLLPVEKRTFFEKHVRSERWRLSTGVKPVAKAFDPLSPHHLLSFHHGFLSTLHPPPQSPLLRTRRTLFKFSSVTAPRMEHRATRNSPRLPYGFRNKIVPT